MKTWIKNAVFHLLGKDPEAVVVSFATGPEDKVRDMVKEVLELIPGRRHFLVGDSPVAGLDNVRFIETKHMRRDLRRYRAGMAPVLFDGDPRYAALRRAALRMAPFKILAYNASLERHHLQLRTAIASWLFWRGVPLDRIHLRPRWLYWTTHERSMAPDDVTVLPGRATRRGHRRIGVLTPFLPYPLAHGGAVRLYYLLREMARDYDVYLFAFREKEKVEDVQPLLELCTSLTMVTKPRYREPRWASLLPPEVHEYESPAMRAAIARERVRSHLDLMQVEYTHLAPYTGDILVEHDVTFDLYEQVHRRRGTIGSWWDLFRWKRFESQWVCNYRRVVTMSEKDARLLGIEHARVIPNGVDLGRFRPIVEPAGRRLLFIGSFRHFPNVMAFRFLLDAVWPRVKQGIPEASLTVVAGPDPELYCPIPKLEDVEILPFVPDVRPLYEQANVVLVPTLVSAGTNVKVLEAMAMERAIVSTTSGCGGIPVKHGEHVWIADGAAAFSEGILHLLRNGGLRRALALKARRLVEEQFDWSKLGELERALLAGILPDRVVVRRGTVSDVEAVTAIQKEALASSKWEPENYLLHEFYVAAFDGTIAGFIVARRTAPDEREILNVAVAAAHRRMGIGERLLETLIHSGARGEVVLEVRESNHEARRLYDRLGFSDVGRRPAYYDDPVETAVIMKITPDAAHTSFENSSASERRT